MLTLILEMRKFTCAVYALWFSGEGKDLINLPLVYILLLKKAPAIIR